jgi:adenine-specific DNA-methyltransferase
MTESLTHFAAKQQRQFDALTSPRTRREQGHFGTSPAIADFMAGMFSEVPQGTVHILDPGAGVGTLSAAFCDRVLRERSPQHLVFELWENDPKLKNRLHETMAGCQEALEAAGQEMEFTVRTDDFILEHAQPSLFEAATKPRFDLAVMNPPYFKVRKDSEHAKVMAHVVHGQPNIYAFFMAVAADLLVNGGELVAITPRSYFNGPYFKRFRKWFFDRMATRHIHVFDSRIEAFREDEVLQENVILSARKGGNPTDVVVTSSAGRELQQVERHTLPYPNVIEDSSGDHVVRVATGRVEQEIIAAMDRLPQRFRDLPFKISTGPVVTFRSTEFLRKERSGDTAPLLWMHNVRPFLTQFPPKNGKPKHILVSDDSKRLLLPAKRYVLLKRFTAKEERRRLVAGIMEAEHSYSPFVGLENHLNYVYRPGADLSKAEAFGLAGLFNSAIVDRYFRTISGNTQVNAAEIRAMPVPDIDMIRQIGKLASQSEDRDVEVEKIVGQAIGLPTKLIEQLCKAAR